MPEQNELQRATSIYESMGNEPVTYGVQNDMGNVLQRQIPMSSYRGGTGPGIGGTAYGVTADPSSRFSGGGRQSISGRSSGGAISAAAPQQRPYKPVEFKAPSDLKMPEYKPPERDEAQEKGFRREYMGPGMAQVRRSTQEAITSSKSFDNPNARALFIRDALKGVGEGVEKVATGAGKEARAESGRRHQEDVAAYVGQWNAKATEATAKHQADWNAAMMQFQEKQYAARQATDPNVSATATAGGSVSGTAAGDKIRSYRMFGQYGGLHYA